MQSEKRPPITGKMSKMKIYGLTGGTGSGKTVVAMCFAQEGIPVIDADLIGHKLIEPNGLAEKEVLEAFGKDIYSEGKIDRGKLGNIVFSNPEALQKLNKIVHPLLMKELRSKCEKLGVEGHEIVITDAAILADNGSKDKWINGLILVLASREKRCQRLIKERGLTKEDAYKRIDAQVAPELKTPLADWIIENDGSIEELERKTQTVIGEIVHGK